MIDTKSILEKLRAKRLIVPGDVVPNGKYELATVCGETIYASGQLPRLNSEGKLMAGRVEADQDIGEVIEAAKLCFIRALLAIDQKLGDLSRVERLVYIRGFINAEAGFSRHAKVLDGVTDLALDLFGPKAGAHARSALGAGSLPSQGLVEIELIAKLNDAQGPMS